MPFIIPTLLYAETHYRFKYFFSFLKKREPEILADIPHRLEPDVHLPVLLLVKDADHYPIELLSVSVSVLHEAAGTTMSQSVFSDAILVNTPLWWKVVHVPLGVQFEKLFGFFSVDVYFEYKLNNKFRKCKNDNYRTSSRKSYRVFRSSEKLPSLPGWIQGDTHTHSSYTNDQVEFGSPIEGSIELSKAMGLSFFCVTDHSYDLDDRTDNYLKNDPDLPKWKSQQNEITSLNNVHNNFAVVRGEEVSVWNEKKRNVHLLLFGTTKYFPGSGDSAERWFRTKAEHTMNDVLNNKDSFSIAYAAHPAEPVPLLQRLFVGRGEWAYNDLCNRKLTGLQILNGETGRAFERGLTSWKKLLLEGKRLYIAAGNDAHGNFNRFKQIKIPFFKIIEADKQLFGKMRTAVQTKNISETAIVDALRLGKAIITNGPIVTFVMELLNKKNISTKDSQGITITITVKGNSTEEFGTFSNCMVYSGRIGDTVETRLWDIAVGDDFDFERNRSFDFLQKSLPNYFRVEAFTHNCAGIEENGFCYTNPIWFD
jgi:hypothetical protein